MLPTGTPPFATIKPDTIELQFHKYHGAGNDFVLIDDRQTEWINHLDQTAIAFLCSRHFGIGADGLMLLRDHPDFDFEMVYFNADGAPSSMCGNGGRCIIRFAADLGLERKEYRFLAVDGPHRAKLTDDGGVSLEMSDVTNIQEPEPGICVLDTGSPHYVTQAFDPQTVDVFRTGREIRNSAPYRAEGINVNFIRLRGEKLHIATYERGVEDETLACGTGVTAAAIAVAQENEIAAGESFQQLVVAKGGHLKVAGRFTGAIFTDIWLSGPAVFVYRGETRWPQENQ